MLENRAGHWAKPLNGKIAHAFHELASADVTGLAHALQHEVQRREHKHVGRLLKAGMALPELIDDVVVQDDAVHATFLSVASIIGVWRAPCTRRSMSAVSSTSSA